MEMRQLRYFKAIAEELHFGAAAQKVCIAQPALSRRVRDLEVEVGVPLIDRRGRRIRLTNAGSVFAEHAARLLCDVDNIVAVTRRAARDQAGVLRVGIVGDLVNRHLGEIIRAWYDANPKADLHVHSLNMKALQTAIQDDEIDVCVGPIPLANGHSSSSPLWQETMVVGLPNNHRSVSRKAIGPHEINNEKVLLPTCNSDLLALTNQLLYDACISPRATRETDSISTALSLVAAGLGVAIVPEVICRIRPNGVSLVSLQSPKASFQIGLIHRCDETSPAVLSFIEIAKEVVRQRQPRTARPPRPRAIAKAV